MKVTNKKLKGQVKVVRHSFTGSNITKYSGLNVVAKYLNRQKITKGISELFPTNWYNATKSGYNQTLLSIVFASMAGINRISKISNFTNDALVKVNLKLQKAIDENTISGRLKELGQVGARKLQAFLLKRNSKWLAQSELKQITLDADSTVSMVYGNQEGAEKGFNSKKKGAKSYHPLLVFVSEIKLLYHTWFRSGSAYTANGIVDFLKEVHASLPANIEKVFFRADSGFFSGALFDLLENFGWDYLVKVKLKNLVKLMKNQQWEIIDKKKDVAICQFTYKANSWKKERVLKAIRTVKEYVEKDFMGQKEIIAIYQYSCYASSYDLDGIEMHKLYGQRSTSETWIEQVKSQLMAGKTLTDDFWANDILWQLNVFAYNVSIMMRYGHKKFSRQEHRTFNEWFIAVPAKIANSGHQTSIKMYEHYYYKSNWLELEEFVNAA